MEKITIGLILAVIPIIAWSLQFIFSKQRGDLKYFKSHLACYILDWLFVPFNLILPFSLVFSIDNLLWPFIVSFIASMAISIFWKELHIKEKRPVHLFDLNKKTTTPAGIVHFIFLVIELTFVLAFLAYSSKNIFSVLCLILLTIFFLGIIPSSRKIHGKVGATDKLFLILGLMFIVLKLIFLLN